MGKRAGVPTGAQIPFLREKRHAAGAPGAEIPSGERSDQRSFAIRYASGHLPDSNYGERSKNDCSLAQTNFYWGAKRARSALGGVGKPVLSGGPLPCHNNRCVHVVHFRAELCWGAKRARSALGCGGADKPALSDHSLPLSNNRVWEDLADGPAGRISELALAKDVADYVRFRAVCCLWRRCSPEPQALRGGNLDSRFFPRRWIMLDKALAGPRCHRFINISTGECIRMDLPELEDQHTMLTLTPEGLLLLLHEPTLVVRLLNPLTRQLTDLPPVTELLSPELQQVRRSNDPIGHALGVYGVGVTKDSTVAVCFSSPIQLAVAKPGDENWTVVYKQYLDSTLPFAGRFYCCVRGSVMVLNTSCSDQPPRLLMAVERGNLFRFSQMTDSLHLVDNDGELMLVHRSLCYHPENKGSMKYRVYRVDLDSRALVPVNGFGGRVVFMGRFRTISLTAGALPSIRADTLYLGFDCEEKTLMNQIDGYNLADGSSEPCYHDSLELVHPCTVVDCLSNCIQGTGDHLASFD